MQNAPERMNDTGTSTETRAESVQVCSADVLRDTIGKLDTLRRAVGPNSPLGSRYSMLSQQIQNLAVVAAENRIDYLTPDYDVRQREALIPNIAATQAQIAQIIRDGGEYIHENHIPANRQAGEG